MIQGINLTRLALMLALAAPLSMAHAHEGHDDAPASPVGTALPRFAATSDAFELVGVLDGKRLNLYLDRAATNEPVENAKLEIDIDGVNVEVAATDEAAGEFHAVLAAPPAAGVLPVTATILAGDESDLLAGELDIHGDEEGSGGGSEATASKGWAAGGGAAVAALALMFGFLRLRKGGAA